MPLSLKLLLVEDSPHDAELTLLTLEKRAQKKHIPQLQELLKAEKKDRPVTFWTLRIESLISRLERSGRPSRWAVHLVKNAVSVHNVYVYVFLTAKVCVCVRHVWLASFLVP